MEEAWINGSRFLITIHALKTYYCMNFRLQFSIAVMYADLNGVTFFIWKSKAIKNAGVRKQFSCFLLLVCVFSLLLCVFLAVFFFFSSLFAETLKILC